MDDEKKQKEEVEQKWKLWRLTFYVYFRNYKVLSFTKKEFSSFKKKIELNESDFTNKYEKIQNKFWEAILLSSYFCFFLIEILKLTPHSVTPFFWIKYFTASFAYAGICSQLTIDDYSPKDYLRNAIMQNVKIFTHLVTLVTILLISFQHS